MIFEIISWEKICVFWATVWITMCFVMDAKIRCFNFIQKADKVKRGKKMYTTIIVTQWKWNEKQIENPFINCNFGLAQLQAHNKRRHLQTNCLRHAHFILPLWWADIHMMASAYNYFRLELKKEFRQMFESCEYLALVFAIKMKKYCWALFWRMDDF